MAAPDPELDSPDDFTTKELTWFDENVRCPICSEIFNNPSCLINCGHVYCNLCLRQHFATLSLDSKRTTCPTCSAETDEGRIKPIPLLGTIISSWKQARPIVLDHEKKVQNYKLATPAAAVASTQSSDVLIVEDPEIEIISTNFRDPNVYVTCPICSKKILNGSADSHIMRCGGQTSEQDKSVWNKLGMGKSNKKSSPVFNAHEDALKRGKKLQPVNYTGKSAKTIKSYLDELGLPITFRDPEAKISEWKKRHVHYISLYNAACDLPEKERVQVTTKTLKSQLASWESAQQFDQAAIEDTKLYELEHRSDFELLIKQAKARVPLCKPEEKNNPRPTVIFSDSIESVDEPVKEEYNIEDEYFKVDMEDETVSRKRQRSDSPFNPQGPRPSQRTREEDVPEKTIDLNTNSDDE